MPINEAPSVALDVASNVAIAVNELLTETTNATGYLNSIAAGIAARGWTAVSVGDTGTISLNNWSSWASALESARTHIVTYTPASFTGITLDSVVAPDISAYNASQWSASDTQWTAVQTALDAFVNDITGADDIDTVITKLTSDTGKLEIAMYAKDLERKQQALRDAYSAAESSTGHKGFLYPNIITVALKLKAQQDYQFDLSQTARTIIEKLFDWAKTNWQFSVDKSISAHQANIDFNMRMAHEIVNSYAIQSEAIIRQYKAQLEGVIMEAEQGIKELKIDFEIAGLLADGYGKNDLAIVQAYSARAADIVKRLEVAIEQEKALTDSGIRAAQGAAQAAATLAASSSQIIIGSV